MTKEYFLKLLKTDESIDEIEHTINKFFDSNVCIPKGENRHKCADLMHDWFENPHKDLQVQQPISGIWASVSIESATFRLNPIEAVYEWKWEDDFKLTETNRFYTEDEIMKAFKFKMTKVESTKQVRK